MSAAELSNREVEAEHPGPLRGEEILPLVRQAYRAPRDEVGSGPEHRQQRRRNRQQKQQTQQADGQQQQASVSQRARSRQAQVRPAAQPPKTQTGRRGGGGGGRRFVAECWAELKKVDWPSQRQVMTGTVVVIIACAIVGTSGWRTSRSSRSSSASCSAAKGFPMFRWYVINTYSGHENKVKTNLEHRIVSMNQGPRFRRVVVPTEQVIETKDGQKVQAEKRVLPGYVLVNMDLDDDAWGVVKNTPGVTGFVGAAGKPIPLSQPEVDRILRTGTAIGDRPRAQVEFSSASR